MTGFPALVLVLVFFALVGVAVAAPSSHASTVNGATARRVTIPARPRPRERVDRPTREAFAALDPVIKTFRGRVGYFVCAGESWAYVWWRFRKMYVVVGRGTKRQRITARDAAAGYAIAVAWLDGRPLPDGLTLHVEVMP